MIDEKPIDITETPQESTLAQDSFPVSKKIDVRLDATLQKLVKGIGLEDRPRYSYSEAFKKLISKEDITKLLEGSEVFNTPFEVWEKERSFIADVIPGPGTLLDIGSANGFLLRCLQEWTGLHDQLVPYGVDTSATHIEEAKQLYPDLQQNFLDISQENLEKNPDAFKSYPTSFDTVYWCIWDDVSDEQFKDNYHRALSRTKPGGRFILGSYLPDKQTNLDRVSTLITRLQKENAVQNCTISAPIENSQGGQALFYIDKNA